MTDPSRDPASGSAGTVEHPITHEARCAAAAPERIDARTTVAAVGDPLLFWSGDAFASQAVVLPLFVQHLAASPLAVGLVPTVWGLGFSVPQLVAAAYAERRRYKLPSGMALFAVQRTSLLVLAALTLALGRTHPDLLLVAFFLLFGLGAAGNGAGIPFYHDVLAKVLPVRVRGRVKALALGVAGVVGIFGGLAARDVLARLPFPDGFALCFAVASALGIASIGCMSLIREPPSAGAASDDHALRGPGTSSPRLDSPPRSGLRRVGLAGHDRRDRRRGGHRLAGTQHSLVVVG